MAKVTFSFGENWKSYLDTVNIERVESAKKDISEWLPDIKDKTVVDVGCGSGIHSLAFLQLGAKTVVSFDVDKNSVEATKQLWEKTGLSNDWVILNGSILDQEFIDSLGYFDIVYSWGVLHHTGQMWKAIGNTLDMVNATGSILLALYTKGNRYPKDLALKKKYNAASPFGKKMMRGNWIAKLIITRVLFNSLGIIKNTEIPLTQRLHAANPFEWNQKQIRGMNTYHDLVDWLGGLPYQVAGIDEMVAATRRQGFILDKVRVNPEGSNSIYLLSRGNKQEISS